MPPCLKSLRKRHNHFVLYVSFFRRLSKFSHHCVPPTTPAAGVCFDFPSHFVLFVLILKKGNFHPTSRTVICITHHPHNHPEVLTIAALCACWHFYCFFCNTDQSPCVLNILHFLFRGTTPGSLQVFSTLFLPWSPERRRKGGNQASCNRWPGNNGTSEV